MGSGSYWTVAKTKQASSRDARTNASAQGFQYYHPMYRSRRQNGVRSIVPLFPFYLCVLVRRTGWDVLRSTRGISNLFMTPDGIPARVPDEDIERFRALENELGYYEDITQEAPRFATDQVVVGVAGLWTGKYGIYKRLMSGSRRDRVQVVFDILGGPRAFEVDAHDLVAAA